MGLNNILKKIAVFFERKNNSNFSFPVAKQAKYLNKFPEPKDDVERSYFQYRCQSKSSNALFNFIVNVLSLPLIFYYLHKSSDPVALVTEEDAVFFSDGKPENIIPESLRGKYPSIIVINDKKECLLKSDKNYFKQIKKRYPFSFHFLLKTLLKIRFYRYQIESFHPESIIVCNEYSFTSSLLTDYCSKNNVRHINVMHGEKIYKIRDSFFRFDACYVWDQFYKDLFLELRAEPKQFIVELPPSFIIDQNCVSKEIDYKYYLGWETGKKLQRIMEAMLSLQEKGFRVGVRPHPRYSNLDELNRWREVLNIEDFKAITIEASLSQTKNAIALFSTVLNQAFYNNVGVVIDDISSPEEFALLNEVRYALMTKEHVLLSQIIQPIS